MMTARQIEVWVCRSTSARQNRFLIPDLVSESPQSCEERGQNVATIVERPSADQIILGIIGAADAILYNSREGSKGPL
jgi:hypothetical protein